jgi:hypothetical protein
MTLHREFQTSEKGCNLERRFLWTCVHMNFYIIFGVLNSILHLCQTFKQDSHRSNWQEATGGTRYVIDVAYRNSMCYNVNSSHRNNSNITFKIITW